MRGADRSLDVGGTGIKYTVLDRSGEPIAELGRIPTPYPCPPAVMVDTLVTLFHGEAVDRFLREDAAAEKRRMDWLLHLLQLLLTNP